MLIWGKKHQQKLAYSDIKFTVTSSEDGNKLPPQKNNLVYFIMDGIWESSQKRALNLTNSDSGFAKSPQSQRKTMTNLIPRSLFFSRGREEERPLGMRLDNDMPNLVTIYRNDYPCYLETLQRSQILEIR